MTVKDLKEGMTCTLISTRKNKKFESKSAIRQINGNLVYVDAIYWGGKLVNLNGASNFLGIDIKNSEPQVFQYIYPEIYRQGGKTYYRIDLRNKSSIKYNRRHNIRCSIGKTVHARTDKSVEAYPCILKDISAVGFALEFKRSELPGKYKEIKVFKCVFADMDPVRRVKITFDLNGIIKRVVESEKGTILFGCQMPYSYTVDKYIKEKQDNRQYPLFRK